MRDETPEGQEDDKEGHAKKEEIIWEKFFEHETHDFFLDIEGDFCYRFSIYHPLSTLSLSNRSIRSIHERR